MKYKYSKLYWFIKDLDFLKIYNSPFKPLKLKWYFGKIALGTPYFFPRKWVKATPELAHEATLKEIQNVEEFNNRNPEYKRKVKTYDEIFAEKMKYEYPVNKRIGFDFVPLGWKTKWENTDYRFEWSPMISFVFFKWQIAVTFVAPEMHHYWECWLYYTRETKGTTEQRIAQARKEFPCVWVFTKDGVETKICYWDIILKNKWI